ncbi:MAG: type II secretion system F family protein [Planctomycetota bacterium]
MRRIAGASPTASYNTMDHTSYLIAISLLTFAAAFLGILFGYRPALAWHAQQEDLYDNVLRRQLLIDIEPRLVFILNLSTIALTFIAAYLISGQLLVALALAAAAFFLPNLIFKHLAYKRRDKLNRQLVDGLTTLASGVRAGLNLTQSMQLVVDNHTGPIKQEFGQLLREYSMGLDLNQAMRNAANRIGSPLYRLTFTAIEMHRLRGGDSGESMDRIAESVREIQRLEGKLDAITSQGRTQANMMAAMPIVMLGILYLMIPEQVGLLFTDPTGRIILLIVIALIALGHAWIKKIMKIDI